jgi:hypothetical protein
MSKDDGDWFAEVIRFTDPAGVTGPKPAQIAAQLGGDIIP